MAEDDSPTVPGMQPVRSPGLEHPGYVTKWIHMDLSYCEKFEREDPAPPAGGFWWCEDHQQTIRINPKWGAKNGQG